MSSKFDLINGIIRSLFDSENDRIKLDSVKLVQENARVRKQNLNGFFYQGQYFTEFGVAHRGTAKNGPLHVSLIEKADLLVADTNRLKYDRDRIRQILALLLEETYSKQDIRDALPNCIVNLVPELVQLERTRPVAYTLSGRTKQQYEEISDKMEYYSVLRLIN